jgi:DNA polymerase-3 subunit alpha
MIRKRPDEVRGARAGPFDVEDIPLDDEDPTTRTRPARPRDLRAPAPVGRDHRVFQLESSGMQKLFKDLKPDCFEDIVAAVALYRPGPLGTGMVEDFVNRKNGRAKVVYPHDDLKDILKDTYGVIVYQEQVMMIARKMGGYSLGGADLLRRAMGKKKAEEMAKQKATFVDGAKKLGYDEARPRSRSSTCSSTSRATASTSRTRPRTRSSRTRRPTSSALPRGVHGATLCSDLGEDREARGHHLRGPQRWASRCCRPTSTSRHKGGQRFLDLFDFCARVDLRRVNKGVIEALVQSGAFDGCAREVQRVARPGVRRDRAAIERGKRDSAERASGQTSLFGLFDAGAGSGAKKSSTGTYPNVPPWDLRELLGREKNALGFYVSGHPLDRYKTELSRFGNASTASIDNKDDGAQVKIGGTIEGLRERPTRTGGKIGFFSLEDASGRIEVIVRDRVLEANREVLETASKSNEPVFVEATVRFERDRNGGEEENAAQAEPKLVLDAVKPLAQALREKTKSVRVSVTVEKIDRKKLTALREALGQHPGPCPVSLELKSVERWVVSVAQTGLTVEPSDALLANLERLFGEKIVELR